MIALKTQQTLFFRLESMLSSLKQDIPFLSFTYLNLVSIARLILQLLNLPEVTSLINVFPGCDSSQSCS